MNRQSSKPLWSHLTYPWTWVVILVVSPLIFVLAAGGGAEPGRQENDPSYKFVQPVAASYVISGWQKYLAEQTYLEVSSFNRVLWVTVDSPTLLDTEYAVYNLPGAVQNCARVYGFMTPDSYHMTFEGTLGAATGHPDAIMSFKQVDGIPTLTEQHWYPDQKVYRTSSYPATSVIGVDGPKIPMNLCPMIGSTCVGGQFSVTWVGEAGAQDRADVLRNADFIGIERFGGQMCSVLRAVIYDDVEQAPDGDVHHTRSIHTYYFDQDCRMVGRNVDLADCNVQKAVIGYQRVECVYSYNNTKGQVSK